MRVENMRSTKFNKIPNQFIITEEGRGALGNFIKRETFQSYTTTIVTITTWKDSVETELDKNKWDCSRTTGKYRNQFLGEDKKTTERKIASGEYKLVDLNK